MHRSAPTLCRCSTPVYPQRVASAADLRLHSLCSLRRKIGSRRSSGSKSHTPADRSPSRPPMITTDRSDFAPQAHPDSAHACKSSSSERRCDPIAPAPYECPTRARADAWQTNGGTYGTSHASRCQPSPRPAASSAASSTREDDGGAARHRRPRTFAAHQTDSAIATADPPPDTSAKAPAKCPTPECPASYPHQTVAAPSRTAARSVPCTFRQAAFGDPYHPFRPIR